MIRSLSEHSQTVARENALQDLQTQAEALLVVIRSARASGAIEQRDALDLENALIDGLAEVAADLRSASTALSTWDEDSGRPMPGYLLVAE